MQITDSKNKKLNSVTGERINSEKYALHVISESSGVVWDTVDATYPDAMTEVFTYSLSAVTVRVVTVVYTDATKEVLSSITRS